MKAFSCALLITGSVFVVWCMGYIYGLSGNMDQPSVIPQTGYVSTEQSDATAKEAYRIGYEQARHDANPCPPCPCASHITNENVIISSMTNVPVGILGYPNWMGDTNPEWHEIPMQPTILKHEPH